MATIVELKKVFINLIKSRKLSHGYLLYGFAASGDKLSFTRELANYLENKKWGRAETPLLDTMIAGGGIDDMRAGISFLWQKPLKSSRKILVIPDAEHLTLEAQNAILKISEEAPSHALILLMARNPQVLLPTLQSRFQKIYVHENSKLQNPEHQTNSKFQIVKNFLKASLVKRKEIIKDVIAAEDEKALEDFVTGLITELSRDKIKNWEAIRDILHRWSMINMYNVNKRLQLEAALLWIKLS